MFNKFRVSFGIVFTNLLFFFFLFPLLPSSFLLSFFFFLFLFLASSFLRFLPSFSLLSFYFLASFFFLSSFFLLSTFFFLSCFSLSSSCLLFSFFLLSRFFLLSSFSLLSFSLLSFFPPSCFHCLFVSSLPILISANFLFFHAAHGGGTFNNSNAY